MQRVKVDSPLNRMAISAALGAVDESLEAMRAQHKSALKTQLELEEALLAYFEKFGESHRFDVAYFSCFGNAIIRLCLIRNVAAGFGEKK